jgi:hypothetical protein
MDERLLRAPPEPCSGAGAGICVRVLKLGIRVRPDPAASIRRRGRPGPGQFGGGMRACWSPARSWCRERPPGHQLESADGHPARPALWRAGPHAYASAGMALTMTAIEAGRLPGGRHDLLTEDRPHFPLTVHVDLDLDVESVLAVTMMKPVLDHYLALVACLSRQNTRSPVRRMLARRRMPAGAA